VLALLRVKREQPACHWVQDDAVLAHDVHAENAGVRQLRAHDEWRNQCDIL
jgi:hypothetical protein